MDDEGVTRPTMQARAASSSRRLDIDGLRALGIVTVVLFHAHFLPGGFLGVDILFVISGYLMATIVDGALIRERFSLIAFYARRALRIVPALTVVGIVVAIVGSLMFLPNDIKDLGRSMVAAGTFRANIYFRTMAADYFASNNVAYQALLHCWSLAVEAQFYILFPIAVAGARLISRRLVVPVLVVAALASFAYSANMVSLKPQWAFYLLQSRMWELLAGALVHFLPLRLPDRGRKAATVAGVLFLALAISLYNPGIGFPGVKALLPIAGVCLVIMARPGSDGCWPGLARMLGSPPVQITAQISYSLYLWHWPLLVFARYRVAVELPLWLAIAVIVLSFVLSYLSWRFIEQPFLRLKVPDHPWRRAAIPLAMMAVLTGTGYLTRNVVPRFAGMMLPPQAVAMANAERDHISLECNIPDDENNPACRFGLRDVVPDTFLWGNSFARMWTPAVDAVAAAKGHGVIAVLRSGCNPIVMTGDSPAGCAAANRTNWRFAVDDNRIRNVVLAANWGDPVEMERELDPVMRELHQAGKRVFIVLNPPMPGYMVPRVLAMALARGDTPPPLISAEEFRKQRDHYQRSLKPLMDRYGLQLIDPTDYFCEADVCQVQAKDGTVLFYDFAHITRSAARRASVLFEPVFDRK